MVKFKSIRYPLFGASYELVFSDSGVVAINWPYPSFGKWALKWNDIESIELVSDSADRNFDVVFNTYYRLQGKDLQGNVNIGTVDEQCLNLLENKHEEIGDRVNNNAHKPKASAGQT